MDNLFEFGQRIIASQPFSRLLGAQLTVLEEGCAEITIPITPELLQQYGFVHGGVISYAADNALAFAGGSMLELEVVSSEYKINFIKPAIGERLVARASVLSAGRRQSVCQCQVWVVANGEEQLCAVAQGTIVTVSAPATP